MRTARLEYPSGREVLQDYWGFLTSGGLAVERSAELADGERVLVQLIIRSLRKEYRIEGQVRRQGERAVIAFDVGQSQDMLLAAAWADGNCVPERRHRRFEVDVAVRFRVAEREGAGRLVNVSRGGCGLEVIESGLRTGSRIRIEGPAFGVDGKVRWAQPGCRLIGVEFSRFREDLVEDLGGSLAPSSPLLML